MEVGFRKADFGETLEKPFDVVFLLKGGRDLFVLEVKVNRSADKEGVGDEQKDQDWVDHGCGFVSKKGKEGSYKANKGDQNDDLERGLS